MCLLKAPERSCDLLIRTTFRGGPPKAVSGLFLPADESLIDFKKITVREKSQKIETLHSMIGLNVDWPLRAKLDVRYSTSIAGLQGDREHFFPGHTRLKDPRWGGLQLGWGLLDRTHPC